MGDTPPLALAAPAGVGQGQGVFVSKHSTAIQKRRHHPMNTTTTISAKTLTLNPGDRVAYSTQFLESIGESHGQMAAGRGIVREREAVNEDSF